MLVARVRERGQLTLPQELRAAAGIGPGSELLLIPTGPGSFTAQVFPPRESPLDLARAHAQDGPAPDLDRAREAAERDLAADLGPRP